MNQNAAMQIVTRVAENILNPLIELLFAAALIYFLFGVMEYVRGADSDSARAEGSRHILWGLIGMLIMIGAFSIVNLIGQTIGAQVPQV